MPRNPGGFGRRLWPLYGLSTLMTGAGLSNTETSRLSGVSRRQIIRLRGLRSYATITTRARLADVLCTSPDDLSGHSPPTYHLEMP